MAETLPPRFDPKSIEASWISSWNENRCFMADAGAVLDAGKEPYVIVIPVSYTHLTLPTNREV